jgi:opacity protein-like surface antigen
MRDPILLRRRYFLVLLPFFVILGCATGANAQGFVSPFIGYNFGGDAGCQTITNCEDKHANYGVAFGAVGSVVGFEEEIAWTADFFGATSAQSTKVLTLMSNFMIAPRIKAVQPYGLGGIGLIRTSVESGAATDDENQLGWDVGGGVMVFFSSHVGVRGDVRYFHSFQVFDLSNLPQLPQLPIQVGQNKLDYGRFAVAVVFKF